MSDIAEHVKKIVLEHIKVEESKVTESASFIDDLDADSLDIVELMMAFKKEFGVEIPDDVIEKVITVKNAIEFIDQHMTTIIDVQKDASTSKTTSPAKTFSDYFAEYVAERDRRNKRDKMRAEIMEDHDFLLGRGNDKNGHKNRHETTPHGLKSSKMETENPCD